MASTSTKTGDACPLCAAAKPTDIGRLFDAVNLSLSGCQLSEYENLGAVTIGPGKLDLRKLQAILLRKKLFVRSDGRQDRTPELPPR